MRPRNALADTNALFGSIREEEEGRNMKDEG